VRRALVPLALALALAGCVRPAGPGPGTGEPGSDTPATGAVDTAATSGSTAPGTGDTGPTESVPPPDCTLSGGPYDVYVYDIATEEDFDFDGLGNLIRQGAAGVISEQIDGSRRTIAQMRLLDPAGIRVLPTGDLVSAQPDTGAVQWIDFDTGGTTVLLGGLDNPNGLVVARDGTVFVSELSYTGRIHEISPDGTSQVIASGAMFPNNMALSNDEQTLYIAMYTDGVIAALDREPGGWSPPRVLYDVGLEIEAIAVDACDNVYTSPYNGSDLVRVSRDGTVVESLGALPSGYIASMRFGSGVGGWQRDGLYVTNRNQVYGIHVAVPGQTPVWE
jgi:hypothetical protein